MSKHNLFFGKSGEDRAVKFLKDSGYRILFRNYRNKLGEIDVIAKDKGVFCFIEVKTRSNDKFGLPAESITGAKQKQMIKTAASFLKGNNLLDKDVRFDVVSVMGTGKSEEIRLIKNAFTLGGI